MGLPGLEHRIQHRNGSWRTFLATITNLLDSPSVKGLLLICQDITEQKLLQEQLYQSQKMEAIGQLAGGVAHDFNNLLTVITGYSDLLLLQHNDPDDPQGQDIRQIIRATEKASSLTRQLLAFSRKQTLQPMKLDLNSVVVDMDQMLRRLIGEDIELITLLASKLAPVKADPGQLEQVIMNLVINARDAMPQGGTLTIETANVEMDESSARGRVNVRPGPYVRLALSDTGQGMTEAVQARIFEPFFTTKEQGRGTGLGLATVHGIVHQSGGHIWVYSEVGRGTTFKIYLPRLDEELASVGWDPVSDGSLIGSETILLVEDEVLVRKLAQRILGEAGYSVLTARQGTEAMQLCNQHTGPIDLLVTDVIMPGGMSGPGLGEQLGAQRSDMKVLYISGYTDDAIGRHGELEPGAAFLEKPFTSNDLKRKVREVLDTRQESVRKSLQ